MSSLSQTKGIPKGHDFVAFEEEKIPIVHAVLLRTGGISVNGDTYFKLLQD